MTEITLNQSNLCHYITDDELERVGEMRSDPISEICLVSVGAFLGAIIPALEQFSRFNDPTNPMGLIGFATCSLAVATGALTVVTGLLWRRKALKHTSLIETIRARPRVQVEAEG